MDTFVAKGRKGDGRVATLRLLVAGTITLTFLFLAAVGASAQYGLSVPSAIALSCDGKGSAPTNVRTYTPMFSWQFSDADAGDAQTAYRIKVGTTPGGTDMWDSLVQTSGTSTRMYGGLTLAANKTYYWAVQVWDRAGQPSAFTPASFAILDIGLRAWDGASTITIAADRYLSTDAVSDTNRLRISKSGQSYSIILVDPSEYDASKIRIEVSSGTKAFAIMVAPLPAIGLSVGNLSFSGGVGGASPAGQTALVSNVGGGGLSGLGASISYGSGSGWLSTALDSATAPATLTVTPSTASMAGGIYAATVAVASSGASNSPQIVNVTLSVTCSVTYAGNGNTGGSVPIDANAYLPGDTVTVLGNGGGLVRTGYAFGGWTDGSGTAYAPGDSFSMGTSNVTLYAKWLPAYTVTYNGNGATGGSAPIDSNAYLSGQTVTVLGSGSLVKSGYAFAGWNVQANGGGAGYTQGQSLSMGSANVTLFARWVPVITTVAGNGTPGYSGDGGPATSAQLGFPVGIAVDGAGNLSIADVGNYTIRKVTPGGTITTVAGTGIQGTSGSGNGGPATSAAIDPGEVAADSAGNLYFADYVFWVRKVSTGGTLTTVAGNGTQGFSGDGGPATAAQLDNPHGTAVDPAGNLYIADMANHRIRKVSTGGTISTVAGNGSAGYSGDGGPATSAQLYFPVGLALDSAGNLYIADTLDNCVRKVSPGGTISTVAGTGVQGYSGDGGPATSAQLHTPHGVALDAAGNLYIADEENQRIRKVSPAGIITTVAGNGSYGYSGDGGAATSAQLNSPFGVAVDSAGNLYIDDVQNYRIRKVTPQ